MNASALISDEKHRMATVELGVNFEALSQLAKNKGEETMQNLTSILEQDSIVLVDPAWDAKEKEECHRRLRMKREGLFFLT